MAGAGGPLRLRDWLVAQIESGRYPGLRWEDAGKTLFRIPWKHAAKQGYQAQQDAALFRPQQHHMEVPWQGVALELQLQAYHNAGSKLHLRPTPQLVATPDP